MITLDNLEEEFARLTPDQKWGFRSLEITEFEFCLSEFLSKKKFSSELLKIVIGLVWSRGSPLRRRGGGVKMPNFGHF